MIITFKQDIACAIYTPYNIHYIRKHFSLYFKSLIKYMILDDETKCIFIKWN